MARVLRRAEARCDLLRIGRLIKDVSGVSAATSFLRELDRKARMYAEFPEMGLRKPWLPGGLRGFMVGRYLVVYELLPDGIAIVRVLYGSKDLRTEFPE